MAQWFCTCGVEHVGWELEGKEGVEVGSDVCSDHELVTPHQPGNATSD
jgi:hypothetical protein